MIDTVNQSSSFSIWKGDTVRKTLIIASCILMLYCNLFLPSYESMVSLGLIVTLLFVSADLSVCIYICSIVLQVEYSDTHTRILLVLICFILLYSIIREKLIKKLFPLFLPCILFGITSFFSTLLGYQTALMNYLFVVNQLLLVLGITYYSRKPSSIILLSFVVSGLCLCLYVSYQYITGNASMFMGSLVFGDGEEAGQVKSLAIGVVVPAYVFLYNLLYSKDGFLKKIVYSFIILVCIGVIVLTYSRGVLLSFGAALSFLILNYFKSKLSLLRIFLLAAGAVLVGYMLLQLDIDEEKMFENIEGGHGRTDIWGFYLSKLKNEGFLGILFGLGPGDSKRITEGTLYSGFYSHSVFLDYFFSCGVFGLFFILYILGYTAKRLFKGGNIFCLGFLLLITLMFSTHGTSTNALFHGLLAICIGGLLYNKPILLKY